MQSDISITKSRSFNVFLRFLQLGLGIGVTIFITYFVQTHCDNEHFIQLTYLGMGSILVSIIGIIVMKCTNQHPKVAFIILFLVNLGLIATIGALAVLDFKKSYNCAMTNPIYKYYIVSIVFAFIIVFMILCFPFHWIQRYSNSPGNLVWPFVLVLDWPWRGYLTQFIIALILLSISASLITFLANLFAMCKGVTVFVKKVILVSWIVSFVFTLFFEGISVWIYVSQFMNLKDKDYNELVSKTTIQMTMMITIIDIIFWLLGFVSLRYENGDTVRDDLVNYGKQSEQHQSQVGDYHKTKDLNSF